MLLEMSYTGVSYLIKFTFKKCLMKLSDPMFCQNEHRVYNF